MHRADRSVVMPRPVDVREAVAAVVDPELPMLTIDDLGILRGVAVDAAGAVTITLTPTYSGCPALAVIRAAAEAAARAAGARTVTVRTELSPAWTTDWISPAGRAKLQAAGISPPGAAGSPVDVRLGVGCPRCGAATTSVVSAFGPTPCTALYRCESCAEPFEHVKTL